MRPATRLRILEYLRKQQAATAYEISRALGMTGADIRHHLAMLETDGLIEVIDRKRDGRGRPANIYRVSHRVLGSGLDRLAGAMIETWLRRVTPDTQEATLRSVAKQLAGSDLPGPANTTPSRLNLAVNRLNRLHYQACWEAGADGPRVIFDHCPYAEIIDRYPELCRMDAYLLELWLAIPLNHIVKLERRKAGFPQCIFTVG